MIEPKQHFLPLYDQHGKLLGVFLSPEIWEMTAERLSPVLDKALAKLTNTEPEPEPLEDWDTLLKFWDFKYPVDKSVTCENCKAHSEDWQADEPRKFRLLNANMGGLVNFECQACHSRITKKHYKKHIECVTTAPKP